MKTLGRLGSIQASFFVLILASPSASATLSLFDEFGNLITPPSVSCLSGNYASVCDADGDGVFEPNEQNAKISAMQAIWDLLVGDGSEDLFLAAKYEAAPEPPSPSSMDFAEGDMTALIIGETVPGTPNSEAGSWLISSVIGNALLTLKGGDGYLVYLLNGGDSGTYSATSDMQLSNVALWTVPLPAAVWLFGSAIAGLAVLRRRRLAVA